MELNNPGLTFTLALGAGIVAQSAARHLRVPGIVLLLLIGALLGPDVANVIRPDTLGGGLDILVGLSVAVILFEGGLNLSFARLRREAGVIRRLITLGVLVTGLGAATAARFAMEWPWPIALTFGAVVTVTGPTVITPLLRRVRVRRNVSTILEAEGVLIDPIGAILAVVALELALTETLGGAARGLLGFPSRLVLGAVVGLVGGAVIALLLRFRKLIPEGLENVLTLSLVLVLFQVSDAIQHESGIMAAAVAGLVVGNFGTGISRDLREFKEELTVLLVGLLFVLLAADVRLEEVTALGWPGVAVVTALMLVVRPLGVAASTLRSDLAWRERSFIAWLGPRGIVAAAVASVFAQRLVNTGYEMGPDFRALVFLVISVTVIVQGFTSGPAAALLGVRRPTNEGHAIVGANALGRALGSALTAAGEDVVLIDTNPMEARAAEEAGLRVLVGNANDDETLASADVVGRRTFSAVTTNESANLLLARRVKENFKGPDALAALERASVAVTPEGAREARVDILFGEPLDLADWVYAFRHQEVEVRRWRLTEGEDPSPLKLSAEGRREIPGGSFPLVLIRDGSAAPVGSSTTVRPGEVVVFAGRTTGGESPSEPAPGAWVAVDEEQPVA